MKNKILVFIISIIVGSASSMVVADQKATSNDQDEVQNSRVIEDLKTIFYDRQKDHLRNMSRQKHDKFIDPFLKEAAVNLKALQYCIKNPYSNACGRYLDVLYDLDKIALKKYAVPVQCNAKKAGAQYLETIRDLEDVVQKIKEESKQNFNVRNEVYETDKFFCTVVYHFQVDSR